MKNQTNALNWFARHKILTSLLVCIGFIVVINIFSSGTAENKKTAQEVKSNANTSGETKYPATNWQGSSTSQPGSGEIEPQENNTDNSKDILSSVDYSIAKAEDISIAGAVRYNVKVVVINNPATKDQVRAVSEKIVKDYEVKDADAISILYYFNKTQIDGSYTLAMAEWAPNGDWSQADLKENQILTYQYTNFIDKERKNEPTLLEREINQAMKDKWYELMQTSDSVTDEEVAKILAPQYGKTAEEMLEIRRRVGIYDLGL